MSATLKIHLVGDLIGPDVVGAAITNVYAYGPRGARVPARDQRNLVIPSGRTEQLRIDVPAGQYLVEANLPSGEVASEDVLVKEGEERVVGLKASGSPHEWLGWQQLLGNVPPIDRKPAAPRPPKPVARQRRTAISLDGTFDVDVEDAGGRGGGAGRGRGLRADAAYAHIRVRDFGLASSRAAAPRPARRTARRPRTAATAKISVWRIDDPVGALSGVGAALGDAWPLVESLRPSRAYAQLAGPKRLRTALHPTFQDARVQLYRLGPAGPAGLDESHVAGAPPTPRRYVLAESAAGVELACLPLPWGSLARGDSAPVEVFIDGTVQPGGFALAISPRDARVGAALGYMSNGSLTAAKDVFDRSLEMLYGKLINPLAAAAGGYCLIGTETGDEPKDWHGWISNLRQWFDWLPDGAIQYGRLKLRHRQSDADVAEARDALYEGYRRGLPFYSLGLQWLIDGLTLLASRETEAADMLRHVRAVAWRANFQQPFTTLRLSDT